MSRVCSITGAKVTRGSVIHRRGMAKGRTSPRAPGKGAPSRTSASRPRAAETGRARAAGSPSQTVGFRMPPRTASAIKAEARRRGTTISALLLEMWAAYRPKG